MKQFKFLGIFAAGLISLLMTSCENQDIEFPDFDYNSVYFAYQYPVRTIVLGEDIVDNTLDNEHKCMIYATMGGVYENTKRIDIDVTVNNALVNNLFFADGSPVTAMPSNYYTLAANTITLDGTLQDGVEVQLTDAFFADPQSLKNTYVIPLQMTDVANADSILSGVPKFDGAVRGNTSDWDVEPKDFVLYCVKYINPWHAYYLRRGKDVITKDGVTTNVVRHNTYVEDDEVIHLSTLSLNDLEFPMDFTNKAGQDLNMKVKLNFDADQNVTVAPFASSYQLNDTVRVYNITTSGNGSFVKEGDKKSWGNKDRDALYLQYNIGYEVEIKYPKRGLPDDIQQVTYSTTDTLVVRDRGVTIETFSPSYNVN
ncbi:DUF5627 domain-containing protein [Mangrovibacterium sp.]|uniref:DUF5627 domain-containing protein n=1 Tax=Mangrovibacterium sp. TaxID=1961364 RepID=UPI003569D8D2